MKIKTFGFVFLGFEKMLGDFKKCVSAIVEKKCKNINN